MFTSTKTYHNYPCAHRQWKHNGNCKLVHGYSRSFTFVFASETRTDAGFVVDFGDLHFLRDFLAYNFDHTLLLSEDDPLLPDFISLESQGACEIRVPPYGVGMEDSAQWLCEWADEQLRLRSKGRAWVVSVESRENDKNSAVYVNPDAGFKGWGT